MCRCVVVYGGRIGVLGDVKILFFSLFFPFFIFPLSVPLSYPIPEQYAMIHHDISPSLEAYIRASLPLAYVPMTYPPL